MAPWNMPSQYTHDMCRICRQKTNWKYLPNERDQWGRTLMVCTNCNTRKSKPGQEKQNL
ncbi:hypothetical protein [Leifsonia sp. Root4]|uniref:hypothetical protein n=1 Tax=Leifsonia sp. Root4 TaxID=1736525 RepID=UPI000AC42B39|nr:hypothetical protein [Leifsonia sp. Root4]